MNGQLAVRVAGATGFRTARVAPEKAVFRPALPLRSLPGLNGTDMGTMTYREQLLHPNWQRKRLEALQKAEFHCERCSDGDNTLHVHHKRYVKGRLAWEYELGELAVLCEACHEEEHQDQQLRSELLARLQMDGPLGIDDFMAHGAGAAADWIADQVTRDLLDAFRDRSPYQFWSGRVGRHIAYLWIGGDGMEKLADLFSRNESFVDEFSALLRKYGIDRLKLGGETS